MAYEYINIVNPNINANVQAFQLMIEEMCNAAGIDIELFHKLLTTNEQANLTFGIIQENVEIAATESGQDLELYSYYFGKQKLSNATYNDLQILTAILPSTPPLVSDIDFTVNGGDFDFFKFSSTGDIVVDWGDGNVETVTGGTEIQGAHTYADINVYQIKVYGTVTLFGINNDQYGNNADYLLSIEKSSSDILNLDISFNNNLAAADFSGLTSCTSFNFAGNTSFNQAADFSGLTSCTSFNFADNTSFNQAADFSGLTSCTSFIFAGNTSFNQAADFSGLTSCVGFWLPNNKLSVSTINSGLVFANSNGLTNGNWDSSGQTPAAAPSGAGAAAKTSLQGKGWAVITD